VRVYSSVDRFLSPGDPAELWVSLKNEHPAYDWVAKQYERATDRKAEDSGVRHELTAWLLADLVHAAGGIGVHGGEDQGRDQERAGKLGRDTGERS